MQLYERTYPRDGIPSNNLAVNYQSMGDYEKAVEEARKSQEIDPAGGVNASVNLAAAYFGLNRFDEAHQVVEQALVQFPNSDDASQRNASDWR